MNIEIPELILIGLVSVLVLIYLFYLVSQRVDGNRPLDTDADSRDDDLEIGSSLVQDETDLTNLQSSMSASSDAVLLAGNQWKLKWANLTACQWFGLNLKHHVEQSIHQIMSIPGFGVFLDEMEYGESFECFAPADPAIHLAIRVVPYRSGQYLLLGRDITKIHQIEQIRRDFVANASHELRTPLSIIYGYLEMMKEEPDDSISPQWRPVVDQMYEQTVRVKQIIEDMMLLSRLEEVDASLEQQFVPMAPIMDSACTDARALATRKKQEVHSEIDENYSLYCNFKEIESLISNLISNAVRYTQEGGSIIIRWKVEPLCAKLTVEDTGIGIEHENIPRLTERFYRTDSVRSRATGGTGLGLAIVNHIVNRHNAKLLVSSKLGEGSVFTIEFPKESIRPDHARVKLLLH